MISIAIVEDEEMYAKQLQQFLHQYEKENKEMFDITVYSDGDQIVNKYKSQYDIILMDVEMKFMDGMSAAEEIRKIDTEVVIIFITNMAQYAIRGYAVDALDYVLKPVSYFAFSQRLNRAISRMKKREAKIIMVNMKGGMVRINVANIYYIESQGHTLILHTILGNYETTGKMKEMEEKLAEMNFCRGNKGYLINLQLHGHALDHAADCLQIAVAAALEGYVVHGIAVQIERNIHRTYAVRLVIKMLHVFSCPP